MEQAITEIKLADLKKGDRFRKEYNGIESLGKSILTYGMVAPMLIRQNEMDFELVDGGRRALAAESAGIEVLHHGSQAGNPGHAGFIFVGEMSEIDKLTIELIANFDREDFTWFEACQAIVRIHRMKKAEVLDQEVNWGQRETGLLLNVALGKVSNAIRVVEAVEQGNEQVAKASTLTDALGVLMSQKEDAVMTRLKELNHIPIAKPSKTSGKKSALGDESNWISESESAESGSSDEQNQGPAITVLDELQIPLTQMLFEGDSVRTILPTWPDETFDHIYTDIPFGIDMENLEGMTNLDTVVGEHEVEENIELMKLFLPEAFRVLKTGGFCVFWYDLDHHEKLQNWARQAGFKVQRWPIFWDKLHPCRNQAAQYNFTKSVETAMVMRKGNGTLINPQNKNIFAADGSIERKMYKNPFAKPFELHKFVLQSIAMPGQTILDNFAGGGSIPRAVANMGMRPIAMEKSPIHFPQLVETMRQVYTGLTRGKAKFV